ncbi:hypothetical protein EJ04DRAFT_560817 [Polyplosphaeria fusca]|uniref:Uncharacterized protein n=1 Tax=Polyplosphaeria fusca TaxID=682080 RepID=A0A9P4R308_9PLEO|nr:hypothetical protein EJ04DRAFT_560817 [Polyplosphaeria fusca]
MPSSNLEVSSRHELHASKLTQHDLFESLKRRIISLATALYGITSANPSEALDVLCYTTIRGSRTVHEAVLIAYTTPNSFAAWEILSNATGYEEEIAALEALLEDLKKGMGETISGLERQGRWDVKHEAMPDVESKRRERLGNLTTIKEDIEE